MSSAVAKDAGRESTDTLVPIRRLGGRLIPTDRIDLHQRICDLAYFEFPLLSLYSDGRLDWLYLWCDTNGRGTDRWLVFPATRDSLVEYLSERETLRNIIEQADTLYLLDRVPTTFRRRDQEPSSTVKRSLWRVEVESIGEYLPDEDSYFDRELATDVDVTEQLQPNRFQVPIRGDWFGQDFQELFRSFERMYAFYYATGRRFVTTINNSLAEVLRAPWMGGFSRVNLYTRLARHVPAIHSLKVGQLKFASPGDIFFDAVRSVGVRVQATAILMLRNEEAIDVAAKRVRKVLSAAGMNRKNLAKTPDFALRLTDVQRDEIEDACATVAVLLESTGEMEVLRKHSPNIVVHSKAVLSLVTQLKHLARMQEQQLLNFPETTDGN